MTVVTIAVSQNNLNVNYSSIDSYNLKLQSIMSRFILEKNHMLTDIVTKSFLNLKLQRDMNIFQCPLQWFGIWTELSWTKSLQLKGFMNCINMSIHISYDQYLCCMCKALFSWSVTVSLQIQIVKTFCHNICKHGSLWCWSWWHFLKMVHILFRKTSQLYQFAWFW